MSLVSTPGARHMAQSRRPLHNAWARANWFFFTCFVALYLYWYIFLISSTRLDHAINKPDNVDFITLTPRTIALIKSPLQELSWMETGFERLSEEEIAIYSDIGNRAALDVKFFAIPETVYPQNDNCLLYNYVEKQLKSAKDVLSAQQAEFVLKLIESGVAQGSMMKKEVGEKGSLKNSIVIALLKEECGNLYFAMAAVSVEPRLGWRVITKKQRNEWNKVLSRVADTRLKQEMVDLFNTGVYTTSMNNKSEAKAKEESVEESVVEAFSLQKLQKLFR